MAIVFNNFRKDTQGGANQYLYGDMHLDIEEDKTIENVRTRDMKIDTDFSAIKNALNNMFNTIPGQKILNPEFGLDLRRFLFEPVTRVTAYNIGETIRTGIPSHDIRIAVDKVVVNGVPDQHLYQIELSISVPSLQIHHIIISSVLDQTGFRVI